MHKLIKEAMDISRKAHMTQSYDEYPYFKHLQDVYEVLTDVFALDEDNPAELIILIAGWLHDTMEDSPLSYAKIKKQFGFEVAEIVFCVTDELGRTRSERKARTYPKISSNKGAIVVKLADRIANVSHAIKTGNKEKLEMYKAEYDDFETHLRMEGHVDDAWSYLASKLFN